MASRVIGILLVVNAVVFARNVEFGSFHDNSEEDDSDITWLFADQPEKERKEGEVKVCRTEACEILGKEFLSSMNKSADPCDDFYDYVCGAWTGKTDIIPPYEPAWGRPQLFQLTVHKRIKGILESEPQPTDILPVRQAKKMYRSCMDVEAREKRGLEPLESILIRTGGWPMVMEQEEWFEGDLSWQEIEKNYFYVNGKLTFYDIGSSWWKLMVYTSSDTAITIEPGSQPFRHLFPSKRWEASEKQKESYATLIENIAKEFIKHNNAAVTDEMLKKDVEALVAFDMELAELTDSDEDEPTEEDVEHFLKEYNGNVTDFSDKDKIAFENLFKMVFEMENIKITPSTKMAVRHPTYYSNLTALLKETPLRTVANYIHLNFVSGMLYHTTEKMQKIANNFRSKEIGTPQGKPRWMECVHNIKMDHASSYAFVTKYFTKYTEKAALEMLKNIREEMESQIEDSNWLDDEAKELSKDKLRSMRIFLGFPEWYRNRTAVMNSYKGLKVGYDYFENILSYQKYVIREKLREMKGETKDESWGIEPVIVNAMYGPSQNIINLPAADFQPPLFTPNLPDYLNYALVGCVVGHEMGHGFDDSGIQMGKDGKDTKISDDMIELYYKRAECFLDQFNEYWGVTEVTSEYETPRYADSSIGRRTRGENIADTTGLHSVFEAYRKLRKRTGRPDEKIPGFEEYTDDQMFFISFGSTWCGVQRPEFAKMMAEGDSHSPGRLRVIGAVSNTNDFAKAFQCPKGSAMNPEDKCNIWKAEDEFLANEVNKLSCDRRRRSSRWALNVW
ncbi:neprilysin-1-like [Diachasmimorpha longicaudata]|uniref:neprilysin-1-like n=1 Tax=Diachasmimorpha longicaudata TaxID=58733 RepID=UPI0030B8DBEE